MSESLLFWLVYEREDGVGVFLQHAHTVVAARMRAALSGVEGTYVKGHELDDATAGQIPKAMISRSLTGKQARDPMEKISVADTPPTPGETLAPTASEGMAIPKRQIVVLMHDAKDGKPHAHLFVLQPPFPASGSTL